MPIINSLLDSDLYKATMQQVALHKFSDIWVKYKFKCRNEGIIWSDTAVERINREIDHYCSLMFTKEELEWLGTLRYIKKDFVDFLRIYRPQREHVTVTNIDGQLGITVEGPWFLTILFEVPLLAIVNEVYFEEIVRLLPNFRLSEVYKEGATRLERKIEIASKEQFLFSDFGTRRRFSASWQGLIVEKLTNELPRNIFGGTSNMYLAMKYNLTPIGTNAHEFYMVGQALEGVTLASSQKYMLQAWVDEYRGDLGTALSDTLGTDKFLDDFDLYFAKLYDGLRHDSGDPFVWGDRVISHYKAMKIDSKTKQLIWSDGLTFEKAANIHRYFKDRARCSFGIGTNLTNDLPGITPLNIVMKVVSVNGCPVAKISDNPSKGMCEDAAFLNYLQQVVQIREK